MAEIPWKAVIWTEYTYHIELPIEKHKKLDLILSPGKVTLQVRISDLQANTQKLLAFAFVIHQFILQKRDILPNTACSQNIIILAVTTIS